MKKEILSRLILEHVKVTWETSYTQFVSYKMTFWLASPFRLLKVAISKSKKAEKHGTK